MNLLVVILTAKKNNINSRNEEEEERQLYTCFIQKKVTFKIVIFQSFIQSDQFVHSKLFKIILDIQFGQFSSMVLQN